MINFFVDKLNWFMEQYNKLAESGAGRVLGMESAELFERADTNRTAPQNNIKNNIKQAWDNAFSTMREEIPEIADSFKTAIDDSMIVGSELFGDEFNKFLDDTSVILNKPLEVDFKEEQLANISGNGGGGVSDGTGNSGGFFNDIIGEMGPLFDTLTNFIGPLTSIFTQITSLSALFNWFQVIIDAFIETIAVPLNQILAPLIGFLVIIGETLGQMLIPVIQMLTPVIDFLSAGLIFLYNYAIRPLANAIIWVIVGLNNAVASAVNAIMKAIDKIPGVKAKYRMDKMDYSEMKMNKITQEDLQSKGEEYITNNGGSTGYSTTGSASYSQARDVYVTINMDYNVGLSAYDDNDIAIKINEGLERAKSLGYI
jgi:hypothetical protein